MIVSKISQVIIYWPLVFMSACNPFWELLYSISLKLSSKVILWTRPLSWFDFIGLHITCMTDIHLLVKQTIQLWTYLLLKSQEFILISPFLPQGKASRLKEVPVVEYVFPRIQTFPWKHRFHYCDKGHQWCLWRENPAPYCQQTMAGWPQLWLFFYM